MKYYQYITNLRNVTGQLRSIENLMIEIIPCSVKRVQRHMKKLEIKSIVVKKYQYQKNQGTVPNDKEISLIVILVLTQYLKNL